MSSNNITAKPAPANGSDWIHTMQHLHDSTLGQITFPGTHHSNAITLGNVIAPGAEAVVANLFAAAGAGNELFSNFSQGWKDLMTLGAAALVDKSKLDPMRPLVAHPLPSLVQQYIKGWSEPQLYSVTEQLQYGVRYLDMRVCGAQLEGADPFDFYSHHMLLGGKLAAFLEEVKSFVAASAQELVFIEAAHMNFSFCMHERFLRMVRSILGDYLYKRQEGDTRQLESYTLGEIINDGPKIILLYDNSNYNKFMKSNPEKFQDVWVFSDQVYDIYDGDSYATLDGLIGYAEKAIAGPLPKNKFVKLQWIMTPGTSDFVKGLLNPLGAHNLEEFSDGSAEALAHFIPKYMADKINVIFVDYFISSSSAFDLAMERNHSIGY